VTVVVTVAVRIVAAGVVNVVVPGNIVVVAQAKQTEKKLTHQESAPGNGAAEIDHFVHGTPSPWLTRRAALRLPSEKGPICEPRIH